MPKHRPVGDGVTTIEIVDGNKLIEMFELHELGLNPITTYVVDQSRLF